MSEMFDRTAAETTSEHGVGVLESAFVPRVIVHTGHSQELRSGSSGSDGAAHNVLGQ